MLIVMENNISLQAEHLPKGLSFENRESFGVQLVFIHKIKWRKSVEYAELTSN